MEVKDRQTCRKWEEKNSLLDMRLCMPAKYENFLCLQISMDRGREK